MPSRPRRSAKAARPEADLIDRAAGAGRRLSLHGRLLRKEARQFVCGLRRMSWLLPFAAIVLLSTWATLLVGLYRSVVHYSGHDAVGLVAVMVLQVLLLVWMHRDASATTRRMRFSGTRRRVAEASAAAAWLFTAFGRRERVR